MDPVQHHLSRPHELSAADHANPPLNPRRIPCPQLDPTPRHDVDALCSITLPKQRATHAPHLANKGLRNLAQRLRPHAGQQVTRGKHSSG